MPAVISIIETKVVPVADLVEFPGNARRGDVDGIVASIEAHGQYRALVVSARTMHVVAGNHTLQALRRLGRTDALCSFVDVDMDEERRIVLIDNRTQDVAGYDLAALAALLSEAKAAPAGLDGTGYTDDRLESLLHELALPQTGDGDGESGGTKGPNLQERFGVPPFSVLDARAGYWQARKRQWIAFGIKGDVGRGDSLDAEAEAKAHANAAPDGRGGLSNQIAPRVNDASAFAGDGGDVSGNAAARQRRRSAAPGGSPAPLDRAKVRSARPEGKHGDKPTAPFGVPFDGGDAWRGHGEKAHAHKSQARLAALQKTGDSRVGPDGRRMTWAPGDKPLDELDDTSARNAGASTSGASMFDPVLCELMLRWFCPKGGRVLDCFAGGPTLGIVATHLGYQFTGVELRAEQIAASRAQAEAIGLAPTWVQGDSETIDEAMPGGLFDLVFTDPPYFNLEFYSSDEANGSAKKTYAEFRAWYATVLTRAASVLRDDRFFIVKIGEARGADGAYVNIVGDTTRILMDAGLRFYNEAILITAIGSLPVRAGRPFARTRKLGKAHQNVIIAVKGDFARAVASLGDIADMAWETLAETEDNPVDRALDEVSA